MYWSFGPSATTYDTPDWLHERCHRSLRCDCDVTIDPETHEMLQYYINVLVSSKWLSDSRSSSKLSRIHQGLTRVIRGCFENELHLDSLLAAMSSRMRYLEGWDVAPATDVFICRALRALRQRLRAPCSPRSCMTCSLSVLLRHIATIRPQPRHIC